VNDREQQMQKLMRKVRDSTLDVDERVDALIA
jgi:hypothetical protein